MQTQPTNAEASLEAKRIHLSKKVFCLVGIAVVLVVAIATLLLTHKSSLEKLAEYVQNYGTPFDGGYRLVSDSSLESGQTSLIAYGMALLFWL